MWPSDSRPRRLHGRADGRVARREACPLWPVAPKLVAGRTWARRSLACCLSLTNVIIVEGCILALALLNRTVYRATPCMHTPPPRHSVRDALLNHVASTVPVHAVATR